MFNSFQKKIFASAITCLAICIIGAFIVLLTILLSGFLSIYSSVVTPVILALIISFMLSPLVEFLSKKLKISPTSSCGIVCVVTIAIIIAILAFITPKVVSEVNGLIEDLPSAVDDITQKISTKYPEAKVIIADKVNDIKAFISDNLSIKAVLDTSKKILFTALSASGNLVSIFSFLAALAVVPIYLYYMLTSNFNFYEKMEENLSFMPKKHLEDLIFFVKRFAEIMATFFRGQMLIAFIMGCLYGVGLWAAGVEYGALLGFMAGMLNLIPYLGTMVGFSTILPVAFFQADGGLLLLCIAMTILCVVQCIEGYILTPKIMGDRTGLHPTIIIFSVFFWGIALNGILGMILAIPLTAFIVAAWQRIKIRLIESSKNNFEKI